MIFHWQRLAKADARQCPASRLCSCPPWWRCESWLKSSNPRSAEEMLLFFLRKLNSFHPSNKRNLFDPAPFLIFCAISISKRINPTPPAAPFSSFFLWFPWFDLINSLNRNVFHSVLYIEKHFAWLTPIPVAVNATVGAFQYSLLLAYHQISSSSFISCLHFSSLDISSRCWFCSVSRWVLDEQVDESGGKNISLTKKRKTKILKCTELRMNKTKRKMEDFSFLFQKRNIAPLNTKIVPRSCPTPSNV